MVKPKFLSLTTRLIKTGADIGKVADKVDDITKSASKVEKAIKGTSQNGASIIEKVKNAFRKYEQWRDKIAKESLEKDIQDYKKKLEMIHEARSNIGKFADKIGKVEQIMPKKNLWPNLWNI